jgi:hypothetical protein
MRQRMMLLVPCCLLMTIPAAGQQAVVNQVKVKRPDGSEIAAGRSTRR